MLTKDVITEQIKYIYISQIPVADTDFLRRNKRMSHNVFNLMKIYLKSFNLI